MRSEFLLDNTPNILNDAWIIEEVPLKKHPKNTALAKKLSWVNRLFEDNKLSAQDKKEVWKRLAVYLNKQDLKDEEKSSDC